MVNFSVYKCSESTVYLIIVSNGTYEEENVAKPEKNSDTPLDLIALLIAEGCQKVTIRCGPGSGPYTFTFGPGVIFEKDMISGVRLIKGPQTILSELKGKPLTLHQINVGSRTCFDIEGGKKPTRITPESIELPVQ